jgi:DNA-binding winged helix-turn-helix (wHTH) protein
MIRIGNLTVLPDRRQLFVAGAPAELGYKAMDILLVLIEANGALVTKDELMHRVWPTTIVAENNLRVQICGIRKVLVDNSKLLVCVPGRGYRLLRPVHQAHAAWNFVARPDSSQVAQ